MVVRGEWLFLQRLSGLLLHVRVRFVLCQSLTAQKRSQRREHHRCFKRKRPGLTVRIKLRVLLRQLFRGRLPINILTLEPLHCRQVVRHSAHFEVLAFPQAIKRGYLVTGQVEKL